MSLEETPRTLRARQPLPESLERTFVMQLASGSVPSMVLKAAIELDLLEIISKAGPSAFVSPTEIASRLRTTNPYAAMMLDRILRLLDSYSIVTCSPRSSSDGKVERLYRLALFCKYLTKNADGVSLVSLTLMILDKKVQMDCWYYLKDAVLKGEILFDKAHGMVFFEYHGKDMRFNKIFNKRMNDHSTIAMKKILETYDGFKGIESLVDVGGGIGASLNMVISKYPSIDGVNFDLPYVICDVPSCPDKISEYNF